MGGELVHVTHLVQYHASRKRLVHEVCRFPLQIPSSGGLDVGEGCFPRGRYTGSIPDFSGRVGLCVSVVAVSLLSSANVLSVAGDQFSRSHLGPPLSCSFCSQRQPVCHGIRTGSQCGASTLPSQGNPLVVSRER
jgi:hypothetical protein